jgi:hypothetical protein
MNTKRSKLNKYLLKGISAFFVFWLSSVLVFFCCGSHIFVASAANVENKQAETCPIGKGHDCCKKKKSFSSTEEHSDCCIFKPQKTLSYDLQYSKNIKQSQEVVEKFETPKPIYFVKTSYKPTKVYYSTIHNRGSTYIQNCVFRI